MLYFTLFTLRLHETLFKKYTFFFSCHVNQPWLFFLWLITKLLFNDTSRISVLQFAFSDKFVNTWKKRIVEKQISLFSLINKRNAKSLCAITIVCCCVSTRFQVACYKLICFQIKGQLDSYFLLNWFFETGNHLRNNSSSFSRVVTVKPSLARKLEYVWRIR